jgi:hypothetical protein
MDWADIGCWAFSIAFWWFVLTSDTNSPKPPKKWKQGN